MMADPAAELAQFEPDPDGNGVVDTAATSSAPDDDPQWIVWPDAADESAWAADELSQLGSGGRFAR